MPLSKVQEEIKRDMTAYFVVFDGDTSKAIDDAYNTLLAFINFINFDYYFFLKKFDSGLPERNFNYKPKFDAINGEYVADDLQDFLEVFGAIDLEAPWAQIFGALKEYKKLDIVSLDSWNKFIAASGDLRKSLVLDQMVRHLKDDPYWESKPRRPSERIVEPFLQKLKTQVETIIQGIIQERRNSKIDEIANQIFGTTVVLRMKNYNEKANVVFAKKMLGGYTQTQAMNYLKAYLMDYFKKDIRELVDLLIIRGQWTANLQSQQLSDCYHSLLDISEKILKFDEELADDGGARHAHPRRPREGGPRQGRAEVPARSAQGGERQSHGHDKPCGREPHRHRTPAQGPHRGPPEAPSRGARQLEGSGGAEHPPPSALARRDLQEDLLHRAAAAVLR